MSNKDEANPGEVLEEFAKLQGGASCVQVDDGHVFQFSKQMLMGLLAKCAESGQDKVIIFIKHPVKAS